MQEEWTEIISPKAHPFKLGIKQLWHYRDLLVLFVKRDLTAQYKQTILGPLWNVIQPVFTTFVFLLVFNKIAKIPTDTLPPAIFYMSGLTIWNYFSSCLTSSSSTFISNASIFGKVYFPRLIMPLSGVFSNMAKFGIQFGLLLVLMIWFALFKNYTFSFGLHTLLIPAIVIIMAALGLGLGIIISSLTTKYRDFTVLVSFGVQLLMYATPVAYPLSYVDKSKFRLIILWNPLSVLTEGFRYALFGNGTFTTGLFIYSILFSLFLLLLGMFIFNKVERNFMDTV